MTIEQINCFLETMNQRKRKGDEKGYHGLRDALHMMILMDIASGECQTPRESAAFALSGIQEDPIFNAIIETMEKIDDSL